MGETITAEYVPDPAQGRRRSERAAVALQARVAHAGLARTICRVSDVSQHGARLETYSPLALGTHILLTLPRIGAHGATVMWANDFSAGCAFDEALDDDAFGALVDAGAPFRSFS